MPSPFLSLLCVAAHGYAVAMPLKSAHRRCYATLRHAVATQRLAIAARVNASHCLCSAAHRVAHRIALPLLTRAKPRFAFASQG